MMIEHSCYFKCTTNVKINIFNLQIKICHMDFRKLRKDQRNNPLKKDVPPHSHAEHKEHLQSTSFGSRTCYPFYPVIVLNSLDLVEVSLTTHRRIYLQINLKYTPLLVNSLYPFVPFQNLS